jgi:competence protein ComGC
MRHAETLKRNWKKRCENKLLLLLLLLLLLIIIIIIIIIIINLSKYNQEINQQLALKYKTQDKLELKS